MLFLSGSYLHAYGKFMALQEMFHLHARERTETDLFLEWGLIRYIFNGFNYSLFNTYHIYNIVCKTITLYYFSLVFVVYDNPPLKS